MGKRVLSFWEFISESLIYEQIENKNAVVFISASTSDTDITDAAAKEMGIKKDTKYKITLKGGLDILKGLSVEYPLLKLAERKREFIKVDEGDAVPKGKDILKIGDKSIEEAGTINLEKSEIVKDDLEIEASNNGILALYRIAGKYDEKSGRNDGITGVYKTLKMELRQSKDCIISIEMGTRGKRKNEWAGAWSGVSNIPVINTLYSEISAAVVQIAGGTVIDGLAKKYEIIKQKAKDPQKIAELINNDMVRLQNGMIKRKLLINTTPINIRRELENFFNDPGVYTKSDKGLVFFTESGINKFLRIREKVIEHFSDSSRPEGFSEKIDTLLPKASEILKKTFGEAGVQTPKTWIEKVQTSREILDVSSNIEGTGMQTIDFEEGDF